MAETNSIAIPPRVKDLTGHPPFGRLTVLGFAGIDKKRHATWKCLCDCGTEAIIRAYSITSGHTLSCGCLQREKSVDRNKTHGLTSAPEYRIWHGMRQRCSNPSTRQYSDYGGRGIRVCERWSEFSAFISDMGLRPSPHHTLDRFPDNDGDYCPENCRWATRSEQSRNTRRNVILTYNGETRCLEEWAQLFGLHRSTLYNRVRRGGWSTERALTTPIR